MRPRIPRPSGFAMLTGKHGPDCRFHWTIWSGASVKPRKATPLPSRRSGVIYAYEFSKLAMAQFQQLDPWLAEEVLDELEKLSTSPIPNQMKRPAGAIFDFTRSRGTQTFYVFLNVTVFANRKSI